MMPRLALALTIVFIGYLIRRDLIKQPRVSGAVWIPVVWLMIAGSRLVSQWIGSGSYVERSQAFAEGSGVDKAAFGALIMAGAAVLARRWVQVGKVIRNNPAITLFILYGGLSVVWSDFPDVSVRRWVKALGDPVMVLVLCTDPFPAHAVAAAIKRCAYVLIPFSVLFCRYYPSWGRYYSPWGDPSYTGVTLDKNMLGYLLFAFGLFFATALVIGLTRYRGEPSRRRFDQIINILFLVMIGWLMSITNSKTALLSLMAGMAVLLACRFATIRRYFGFFALATIVLVAVADALLPLRGTVVEASGRDLTFTGRTILWEKLLQEPINPLLGVGYASFWHGERLARYWAMYPKSPPFEAHNGYIEVYLNLGLIGVCLLAGVLWTGFRNTWRRMEPSPSAPQTGHEPVIAAFGIAYCVACLLYNVTEATFQGANLLFIIFLTLACDHRAISGQVSGSSAQLRAPTWKERRLEKAPVERRRRYHVVRSSTQDHPVGRPVEAVRPTGDGIRPKGTRRGILAAGRHPKT